MMLARHSRRRLASPSTRALGRAIAQAPRKSAGARRGASLVLIVFMLFTFVITAALTVDYAYMQLTHTELRVATDAAAKAGAEALARTEQVKEAKAAAVHYAGLNTIAGDPLRIRPNDVAVGRLAYGSNGRWEFVADLVPPNAVRVDARTGDGALHPAIPLFFGKLLGRADFSPSYQATAGQQEVEICLCLDRSGSMLFDMTGEEYSYAPDNPLLCDYTEWGPVWQNHLSPPHPTLSRWAVLRDSIALFLNQAAQYTPPPRTALVTWASDYTMPVTPYTVFEPATVNTPLPSAAGHSWGTNRSDIEAAVQQLSGAPMMGATNLSAGLDMAVGVLTAPPSEKLPNKVIILLTDGLWNEGRDPRLAAEDAKAANIVIHAVTMLTAHQPDIAEAAAITGGRYYNTQDQAQLRQAFQDIARSLQVVLTD